MRQTRLGSAACAALLVAAAVSPARPADATVSFVEAYVDDVGADGLWGAFDVVVSPDGLDVYVAGKTDDAVAHFARSPVDGALAFVAAIGNQAGVEETVPGLDRPVGLALAPDGAHLYVAASNGSALVVFARSPADGSLSFVESVVDGVDGVDGIDRAFSVAPSPEGAHLYATGFLDDAVAVFARAGDGTLAFVEVWKDDGAGGAADGLNGAQAVAVSPDGRHVYVAGGLEDAVACFGRNPLDGTLTFESVVRDGVAGVDGIDGPRDVTLSPDGANLYVAGGGEDAVAAFTRDADDGSLTFLEAIANEPAGDAGLAGAMSVAVSADGAHVFVAAKDDDSLVVFSRAPETGRLAYAQGVFDGVPPVETLSGAVGVAVSPDGAHVLVASESDDALTVFAPEPRGATATALLALAGTRALGRGRAGRTPP